MIPFTACGCRPLRRMRMLSATLALPAVTRTRRLYSSGVARCRAFRRRSESSSSGTVAGRACSAGSCRDRPLVIIISGRHIAQCRCRMLRQIFCCDQLRSAIVHGHATVRHVSIRVTGTTISNPLASQSRPVNRRRQQAPAMSATAEHQHTNRLAKEQSPYLLQHQYNPVTARCMSPVVYYPHAWH